MTPAPPPSRTSGAYGDERKPYDPDYINGLVDHLFETQRDMSVDYHEHLRLALDKLRL